MNLGLGLWFAAKVLGEEAIDVDIGGRRLTVDSPRIGLIGVPDDYLAEAGPLSVLSPWMRQMIRQETLVHEARHSDCPRGLPVATLERAREARSRESFTRGADLRCGHMHVDCREGIYRGLPACDDQPWGSYSAGLLFHDAVMRGEGLSARERQVAEIIRKDLLSRLNFDHRAMLDGELGPPDMSHLDAVVGACSPAGEG